MLAMKKIILLISVYSLIASAITLVGCKGEYKEHGFIEVDHKFTIESFKDHKVLQGSKLDLGTVLAPLRIFHHDSLLFVTAEGVDKIITIYNQHSNFLHIGNIVQRGMGPDELLSVVRMDFNPDGTFWAHDMVTGRLKKFKLEVISDAINAEVIRSISLKWPVMNAFVLESSKVGTTTHEIIPFKRFHVYDSLGNRITEMGDYPNYEREIPPTAAVDVYNAWVSVHPDKSKFVIVHELTDLIEFYNSEFTLIKRVQGPHNFVPQFELIQRGNSMAMVRKFDLTKFAFQGVVSNDSLIFMLYANGETVSREDDPEEAAHFKVIIAVDWEGNPLYVFELSNSVISICVDWHRRTIYGLNRIESEVYAFSY
jgi:hypothetical protein